MDNRERGRPAWRWRWVTDLALDVRFAARGLRNSPGFTIVAVSTLAIGIGINVAVFTVADAVLSRGFRAVARNDRLLYVGTQRNGRGCCASYPDFVDWRAETTSFTDLGAVADQQITFADSTGAPEHRDATRVTTNTFRLLGTAPVFGRDFDPADENPGAAPVAILGFAFWQGRYGGDPNVLGRIVRIDGTPTTIVGVMPRGFLFPQNQDLWLPLVPTAELLNRNNRTLWFAFGRLVDGATMESARSELTTIGRRLEAAYPKSNAGWTPTPRTFAQFFVGTNAPAVYRALWGAVLFVLLIACANFANLLLARAIGRSREMFVRIALGAGRLRIVRQLVVENLMLAAAAGAGGWWLAAWGVRSYEAMANPPTRSWSAHLLDLTMDSRVLLYAVAVSAFAGLLVGVVPAARLSRPDVSDGLKEAGRGATAGRRQLSSLLVSAQLALSIVLVLAAGVMTRSFIRLNAADLGIKPEHLLTALVSLPSRSYPDAASRVSFFDRLATRLVALPSVRSVAIASVPPASGGARAPYDCEGVALPDGDARPTVTAVTIGPGYLRTLGAALLSGRDFVDTDADAGMPAAIVNEQFARTQWPGEDPVGKRLRLFDGPVAGPWLTVVGVATDIVQDVARQRHEPIVYRPFRQQPSPSMWVFADTQVAPAGVGPALERVVAELDRDLPVWIGPYPLTDRLEGTGAYWNVRNEAAMLFVFAAAGLVLSALGLYAVVAYWVSRRTQEIGIRIAIGATTRDIVTLVASQGMRPILVGLAAGLVMSFALIRLLASELVQVSPADPATYVVACFVLLAFAAFGCIVPARRAMRVDPVVALRAE